MNDSWGQIIGLNELMTKAGLDPRNESDVARTLNWLRNHNVPYALIGRGGEGRQRGILVVAEDVANAIRGGRRRRTRAGGEAAMP